MRTTYWQKIETAKAKGISAEQFERVEGLEAAIAYHENKITEYERELKNIEEEAKCRLACRIQ